MYGINASINEGLQTKLDTNDFDSDNKFNLSELTSVVIYFLGLFNQKILIKYNSPSFLFVFVYDS